MQTLCLCDVASGAFVGAVDARLFLTKLVGCVIILYHLKKFIFFKKSENHKKMEEYVHITKKNINLKLEFKK